MKLRWYPILIALAVVLAAGLFSVHALARALAGPDTRPAASKAPMLISITKGTSDLQAVSMALGMAGTALKEGHEVTVFLSVQGPQLASKDLGDDVKIADFPPVRKLLADVIAGGGKVLVCGHCAEVCKMEKKSLVEGATACTREEVLGNLKPGMVCLSY